MLEEKPSWFDQDIEKQQANLEEQKEIEKMLETI